jgi:hypothetical protein
LDFLTTCQWRPLRRRSRRRRSELRKWKEKTGRVSNELTLVKAHHQRPQSLFSVHGLLLPPLRLFLPLYKFLDLDAPTCGLHDVTVKHDLSKLKKREIGEIPHSFFCKFNFSHVTLSRNYTSTYLQN